MKNYRYELAKQRKKEIETHRYFQLFTEYLDLLETEKGGETLDPGKMAIRANVSQYEQKLQHFYSTALSGEHRDRLEKEFDEMNAYHFERTGQKLFEKNPVSISREKLLPR